MVNDPVTLEFRVWVSVTNEHVFSQAIMFASFHNTCISGVNSLLLPTTTRKDIYFFFLPSIA